MGAHVTIRWIVYIYSSFLLIHAGTLRRRCPRFSEVSEKWTAARIQCATQGARPSSSRVRLEGSKTDRATVAMARRKPTWSGSHECAPASHRQKLGYCLAGSWLC